MKKKLLFAMILTLLFALCLTAFLLPAAGEETVPSLTLEQAALSFRDSIAIKYAVRVENAENVSLLCWTSPQTDYVKGTEDRILSGKTDAELGEGYLVFDYTGLAAKQMTEEIYVRAYALVDGQAVYSNVRKYSILEYAYTALGKLGNAGTSNENLKIMMEAMLAYGGAAQTYLNYSTDRLASAPFYLVTVAGGALSDGTQAGLYPTGASIPLVAPLENAAGATFSHWENADGIKVSEERIYAPQMGSENASFRAVYVKYSKGLEFESLEDGTCVLLGMGECTDTDLVIPPTSPTGDKVVEIDNAAFAGEAITSVTFPTTLESVGRNAFNNCASLTRVYYAGGAEGWANVYIHGTGNAAISGATVIFLGETKFTVSFVDHDGTLLKKETVEKGASATAPEAPLRPGYAFTGWDTAFDNVTKALTVTATYQQEHNQLFFTFTENADGTVTALLSVEGDVRLFGLEALLYLDLVGMRYDSQRSLVGGSLAHHNGEYIKLVFTTETGLDTTERTELLEITFRDVEEAASAKIRVESVIIFDETQADETYTVAGNLFQK